MQFRMVDDEDDVYTGIEPFEIVVFYPFLLDFFIRLFSHFHVAFIFDIKDEPAKDGDWKQEGLEVMSCIIF